MYTINPFEVVPNLYIGNAHVAARAEALKMKGVRCVVNVTKDVPFSPEFLTEDLVRLPIDDDTDDSTARLFIDSLPHVVDRIAWHISHNHGVLVHCRMGQQRAPTVVAAYLMRERNMSASEAMQFVQLIKPDAFLGGPHFAAILDAWQVTLRDHRQ
jgi:hypothetical protein